MYPTTHHETIRKWAHLRQAVPGMVRGTNDGVPAVLKFIIPGANYNNRNLEQISWEFFFLKFDLLNLSFAYEDWNEHGQLSSNNQLLQRDGMEFDEELMPDKQEWN